MSSSTLTGVDALSKIKELECEASQVQQEADEKLGEIMSKIRDAADSFKLGVDPKLEVTATSKTDTSKTDTSKANTSKANTSTAKRKAVKKKAVDKASKPRANSQPLREVIWDILARGHSSWKKTISDLPNGVIGLKAVEIKIIIETEGSWVSKSNVANQISTHLKAYRKADKMELGEQKRYNIMKGAEFE